MHRPRRHPPVEALDRRTMFAGGGLVGSYRQQLNLVPEASVHVSNDRPSHRWASGQSPTGGTVDATTFSATWEGLLTPAGTATHRFYVTSDGGVRVWVNHQLIVDDWATLNRPRELHGQIALKAGEDVAFHVDYQHDVGPATIVVRWQTDRLAKQAVPLAALRPSDDAAAGELDAKIDTALAFAKQQVKLTTDDLKPGHYPSRVNATTGKWDTGSASAWTSGYFGGALWELDRAVGGYASTATKWTLPLASTASLSGDHFGRIWATFKPLYDKTRSAECRDVLLAAARSKADTWSKKVHAFATRDLPSASGDPRANFGVLMDQTMDMELLLWAADQTNDSTLRSRVLRHMTTVADTMVRANGSVVQRGFFDGRTGESISLENYQGYSNASTWSRGQAWAIYSFSKVAELTGDATMLATARRTADYFVTHLPTDAVPYWDFGAPPDAYGRSEKPRDTSAAAIAVNGLLRISKLLGEPTTSTGAVGSPYRTAAGATLSRLVSPSWLVMGQPSKSGTALRGILARGSHNVPKGSGVEVPLASGDYYLLQAINAWRDLS